MVLKYYSTGAEWVMRCDPPDVESFQLHFQFDAAEAAAMGIDLRNPFSPGSLKIEVGDNGMIQVSGSTPTLRDGDVDIFEVRFAALSPLPPQQIGDPVPPSGGTGNAKPLDQIKFTTFATGNDYIISNDGGTRTRFRAAEIGAASRTVTPGGVAPLIWDANGLYNDGILGGTGTWDTVGTRFDNLPRGIAGEPLADVAWNNTTNVFDIAAFGGNGGTVTVATISAGGLQFDSAAYTLNGGTITLSRPIAVAPSPQTVPTIDTGENSATINTALAGSMGFRKLGKGTLTLGGTNTYTGTTLIEAGTVKLDRTVGGTLNNTTPVTIAGNATFSFLTSSPPLSQALGALNFAAGDGNVELLNATNGTSNYLTFVSLARAPGATGNFAFPGGGTFNNAVLFTAAPVVSGFINQGFFTAGNGYAIYFTSSGVLPINYGGTPNSAATNTIVADNHISLTATQPAQNTISLRTLRLVGAVDFTLNAGQTLTLSNGGLLKTFFGQSTITGGTGITTGAAEFVVRPVDSPDTINIATPILASSTGGLTKSGAGTLLLSAANTYSGATIVNQGRLLVNGSVTSPITLRAEATLGGSFTPGVNGSGTVGTIAGAGTISPGGTATGNSAGILTAQSVDGLMEPDFRFDVGATGMMFNPSNDLLHLTGATPFTSTFCAGSRVLFDFQLPSLTNGMTFIGGFFTDSAADFSDALKNAAYVSTMNGGVPVPENFGVVFNRTVAQTITIDGVAIAGRAAEMRVIAPKMLPVDNGAWATGTQWFTPGVPTTTDNAVISGIGTIDINGASLAGSTQVQDLSFTGMSNTTLANNSTTTNMVLSLNGGRGTGVPLIKTNADTLTSIVGTNTAPTPRTLTLRLLTGGAIRVEGAGQLDISAVIEEQGGSFALTKTGTGVLSLGGANTFTGGMTVSAGTLDLFHATAAGSGGITVAAGGRLVARNLSINNAVTLSGGELRTRGGDLATFAGSVNVTAASTASLVDYATPANSNSINVTGVLSGNGGLTISGNSPQTNGGNKALVLTNPANNYSGAFNIGVNQILRNAPAATGKTLGTGSVNLNDGTLQLRDNGAGSNGTLAYNNNVSVGPGRGTIDVDRVSANTANTFQLGTLTIGAQRLSTVGATGYGLRFGATTLTGDATFNATTAPLALGPVSGAFGFAKIGSGTLTLTGATSYTGLTTIAAGTLKFEIPGFYTGFTSDIVNDSRLEFNMSGAFNRNITGTGTIARNTGEFVLSGGVTANTQSWVLTGGRTFYDTQANLGTGAIAIGTGGLLIKSIAGDLTLANAVTLNDGGGLTTRYGGTLTVGNVTLPGSGFIVFSLDDQPTSTLSLNGPGVSLIGGGLFVVVGGSNAIVGEVTLGQFLGGGSGLTKNGPGTLIVTGTNAYTGQTTINGGTLRVGTIATAGTNSAIGAGSNIAFNGGTLQFTGASGSTNRTVTLGASGGTISTPTNLNALTLNGSISGTGGLTKMGFGTLTLNVTNSYAGTTLLSQGSLVPASTGGPSLPGNVTLGNGVQNGIFLSMGASNQFGPNSVLTFNNGPSSDAKFELRGTNQTVAGIQSDSDDTLSIIENQDFGGPASSPTLTINNTANFIFTGLIRTQSGGALLLVKNGPGTQEVRNVPAQTNNFGALTINAGRMTFNYSGATGAIVAGTIAVSAGGQLGLDGAWTLTRPVSGAGTVIKLGSGAVTINSAQTYATLITQGSGSLTLATSLPNAAITNTSGTLNLNANAVGSTLAANAVTNVNSSQTLIAVTIGAGGLVRLSNVAPGLPEAGAFSEEERFADDAGSLEDMSRGDLLAVTRGEAVPETGTLGLLAGGVLELLRRRKRDKAQEESA